MDICAVPMSWLLWLMLQWTQGCRYLFKIKISISSNVLPQVELLDHMLALFLTFGGTPISFSIVVTPFFNFLPTVHRLNTREMQVRTTEKPFWASRLSRCSVENRKQGRAATKPRGPLPTSVHRRWEAPSAPRAFLTHGVGARVRQLFLQAPVFWGGSKTDKPDIYLQPKNFFNIPWKGIHTYLTIHWNYLFLSCHFFFVL